MPAPTIQSVAFVSLGCAKNLVDSERMLGLLAGSGLAITSDPNEADAIVINTCGFLEASKEESMREINQAIALKESGNCQRVVVAGCLVQRHKTKLLDDAPGIDRLVGVFDREHIVEAVQGASNPRQAHGHFLGKYHDLSRELTEKLELENGVHVETDSGLIEGGLSPDGIVEVKATTRKRLPVFEDDRARLRLTPRHYAYLRMSEGCNQGCSFCTIPGIRGPMRSKPMEQILAEARELAADGAVELNLIGQDTTSYGTDINLPEGLSGLLRSLNKNAPRDVRWLRLMYAYPTCFTDDMIKTIADCDRVVKYIDMPLQHINDRLLSVMKRRVTRREIETLLGKLRKWIPGMAIRTTFIAGSPGETEAEHQELVQFVKDFGFDHMGVFPFSPEPGTPMGRMTGQLPDDVKQARVEELMLAQQELIFARNENRIGEMVEVMIESKDRGGYIARTAGQAPDIDSVVYIGTKQKLIAGDVLNVKITDFQAYDLVAQIPAKRGRSLSVVSA
ncbi:MAG TPA: 30S ribosomal protein S12 methylthiotransferase RimO [Tepidisphaeraceae bacterium]|jgi:ribosomal protein S12 methylthiotransferase